jgi:protocatechuate 3,4-dioxygenase beta subunit
LVSVSEQQAERAVVEPGEAEVETTSVGETSPEVGERAGVRARFVDERGNPIAGAELRAVGNARAAARSDADGNAELELDALPGAGPLPLSFEARCAGFASDVRRATVGAGERVLLGDWTLVAGGGVEGRVADREGRGLEGVRVACLQADLGEQDFELRRRGSLESLARPGARVRTEPDGSFRLEEVPAGTLRLVAVAEERPAGLSEALEVPAGGWARGVTIELERADGGTAIGGIVLGPDGSPHPDAEIRVAGGGVSHTFSAAPDGRFRVQLGHRSACEVSAFDRERRHREAVLADVVPGTIDLVLRLTSAPEFEVLVLARDGGPLERFAVGTLAALDSEVLAFEPEVERSAGRARLGVPAQDFVVEVRANGWMPARLGPFPAADPPPRVEFRLDPAAGVLGIVEADGRPVSGAWVALYEAQSTRETFNGFPLRTHKDPAVESESDAVGRFTLSVERAGTYYLLAQAEGWALTELGPLELTPDEEREQRVVLGRGGTLAVRVRSARGASPAGKLVAISRGDGFARTQRADSDGSTSFPGLTPGPWQVQLSKVEIDPRQGALHQSTRPAGSIPTNCRLFEGETTHLDLWLETDLDGECQLTGRLVIDGRPAEDWLAGLDLEHEAVDDPRALVEPGVFRVAVDEPGSYRLNLRSAAQDPRAMLVILDPVELVPGEQFWSLELECGTLEGTLPSTPAAGAQVFHRWQRGTLTCLAPLVPDAAGRFRRGLVPAGRGALVSYDPALPLEEQMPAVLIELELAAGQTLAVELAR